MRRVRGEKNILELSGEDHKRIRGALVSFLKPEALKQYVGKMDEEARKHMEMHWHGKNEVNICDAFDEDPHIQHCLFTHIWNRTRSKKRCTKRLFQKMIEGMLSVPVNLLSLRARAKMKTILMDLISEERVVWAASMTHMDETIFPNPSKIDPTRFEQQAPAPLY
ncbi:hypothetical protein HYC85_025253 [Camellia sinensis]|uniref:Uncharacterized protein n=1 Tax=Camellia sinensis TaxID=4442 RepID=A0A7J7GAY5_CAMSI|nr:hypothetical protein HYC85_025253 [Camellia sinensis]